MRIGLVQRVTTEKQHKMASSEKHLLVSTVHQSERNQGKNTTPVLFRGLLLNEYSYAGGKQKREGRELTQDPQMLVL